MQYTASGSSAARQSSDCIVVGAYTKRGLNSAAEAIDAASKGYLTNLAKSGDLPASRGATTLLRDLPGVRAKRVLIVGLGDKAEFCIKQLDAATEAAVRALSSTSVKSISLNLGSNAERFTDAAKVASASIAAAHRALYRFDQLKTGKNKPRSSLRKIEMGFSTRGACNKAKAAFKTANATAVGVSLTKDLGNLPPNICTPDYLAKTAKKFASDHKNVSVQVMGMKDLKRMGMGAFIAVTQGAERPPRLIVMRYKGAAAKEAPVALVGKGITFDTGGISLKPPPGMDEMKYDMCGAGAVIGAFKAIAMLQPKLNLVAVVAACENMPGSKATRPGDIVTTMSGQTVEILNTDAEGRLILCDAMTYTKKFKPKAMIDVATLTGACVIALGEPFSGLMSPHDGLANDLLQSGVEAGDAAWRLPVTEDYQSNLSSNFADFANVGGRPAGATTAACYLSRFVKDQNWAHLDIAGSAWKTGAKKGATGRPVGLLVHYILNKG
ncbi:MAG: leucyl aminopeptidase [Gammaproteobacteria bacterium]